MKISELELKAKIWLEKDGKVVFGEGRRRILEEIKKEGSINKAAKNLSMSYRSAWGRVKDAEERLGVKLIESKVGGLKGGGAYLTKEGEELLQQFSEFKEKSLKTLDKEFFKIKN